MANTDYYQDPTGTYWYQDQQTGAWQYYDGARWMPSLWVPPGFDQRAKGRRLDYRDRTGTFWRFYSGVGTWERYEGTQWVASSTPPPGSVGSFNPLTPGGRRRNQKLLFVTFAVIGSLLIGLAVATNMHGEVLVGLFMWIVALVAGVNSLRKQKGP